ncbi:unnamed protein product [Rotaria sp. Silwood2]|nr:unnamed protein product [Rotaria sp. Silwood2]CAF4735560.1 unnamed protein product [Rotaria sp. Silwood2]
MIDNTTNLSDKCKSAMICVSRIVPDTVYNIDCNQLCQYNACRDTIKMFCPSIFEFPSLPVVSNHVYFIYANHELEFKANKEIPPTYVCYDEQLCINYLPPTMRINDRSCRIYK